MPGQNSRNEGLKRAVQVRLTSPPEVLGTLPGELAQQVVQFVEKNRDLLFRDWKGGMSTLEAFNLVDLLLRDQCDATRLDVIDASVDLGSPFG
jgi:hypothetical protein